MCSIRGLKLLGNFQIEEMLDLLWRCLSRFVRVDAHGIPTRVGGFEFPCANLATLERPEDDLGTEPKGSKLHRFARKSLNAQDKTLPIHRALERQQTDRAGR